MRERTKKRLPAMLCAVCLLLAVMCSCGTPATETSAPPSEPDISATQPEPVQASAPEPAVSADSVLEASSQEPEETEFVDDWVWPVDTPDAALSLWYAYPPFFPNFYDSADEFPAWVYCQEKTGIDIQFEECTFMNAQENLTLMIASGSYTDMFFNMSNYVTTNLEYAVNESIVVDIAPCPVFFQR